MVLSGDSRLVRGSHEFLFLTLKWKDPLFLSHFFQLLFKQSKSFFFFGLCWDSCWGPSAVRFSACLPSSFNFLWARGRLQWSACDVFIRPNILPLFSKLSCKSYEEAVLSLFSVEVWTTTTSTAMADELIICVSKHQELSHKQDTNDKNNNLKDNGIPDRSARLAGCCSVFSDASGCPTNSLKCIRSRPWYTFNSPVRRKTLPKPLRCPVKKFPWIHFSVVLSRICTAARVNCFDPNVSRPNIFAFLLRWVKALFSCPDLPPSLWLTVKENPLSGSIRSTV